MLDNTGHIMVLLTVASVIVATAIKVAWITPILHAGAVFPFYYSAMKQHKHRWALALVARWAAAVFVATIALGVFVPARMEASLLFSARTTAALESWLTSAHTPPLADYSYILWGLAAFLVGSVISGGLAGFFIGSLALGGVASGTLFLFEHGKNVVQITMVAVPPWQWSLLACGVLLLVPAARPFFDRFLKTPRADSGRQALRVYMYAGAGCFVLSVLLRMVTAGLWHGLLVRWTFF